MVAGVGSTSFGPILKTLYPAQKYLEIAERVDPFYGMVAKKTDFEGDYIAIPAQYGLSQSVGASIAIAESNASDSKFKKFLMQRIKYYGSHQFERELMLASKSDKGAFLAGMKKVIGDAAQIMTFEAIRQLYGTYGGYRGRVSSISTTDIVLDDPYDGVWFAPGMILQLSDTNGTTGAVRSGTVTISTVTRTGTTTTITCTGNVTSGIAAAVANDYIYRYGDFGACWHGLGDWNPTTAPTSGDSHLGVDRSVAVDELAGLRVTSTATNLEDAIQDALAEFDWRGATNIDYGLMHVVRFTELAKEAGSRITRDDSVKSKEAGIGYKALSVMGPRGVVRLLPTWAVKYNQIRFITSDSWKICSLGPCPDLIANPVTGNYIERVASTDRYKVEHAIMGDLGCWSPKDNGVLTIS